MRINWSTLKNLPVVTESGDKVGRLTGVELDVDQHAVVAYLVAPGRLARTLQRSELRVMPAQVCSISATEMVVVDGLKRDRSSGGIRARLAKPVVPAISTRAN